MRAGLLTAVLLAIAGMSAPAQTSLTGLVVDTDGGAAVAGASARLVDAAGRIKRFANTKADGVFRLPVPAGSDSMTVQVAKMGYAVAEFPVSGLNLSDTLRVTLHTQAIQLREVGVRASRIRENGDTVTYSVGQFARKQDTSIGDVMNRMPGIEVDDGGKVKYQGADINKFYVEGTDLAGGKYGTITKGLAADNVKAVEVLENHQPMQVLRGLSFSDRAAVNLKLKEKSKANVMLSGSVGGGWGDNTGGLYGGDIFVMTVKGRVQNITKAELNNRGRSLGGMSGFYGSEGGERLDAYTSIGAIGGSGNSRFGRSASVSTSTVWKNSHGAEWRVQADYAYNHLWADRSNTTTYYLENGNRVILENRHGESRGHTGSVSANYELNEKRYYLANTLTANLSWSDTHLDITGTMPNSQRLTTPDHEIVNRLKLIRRFGERHIVTFNSVNQWLLRPEHLYVAVDGGESHADDRRYGSDVRQQAFFTDERASYGFIIGRAVVTAEAGVSGFMRHLDTDIWGNPGIDVPDASNDMGTDYFRLYARPKVEINLRRISFNFSVPVSYYHYWFGGALANRNEVFVSPRLTGQWKPDSRHTVNFSASANRSPAGLHNILCHDVLGDYRTFNAGADDYYSSRGQSVSAGWNWRNPRRGWFADAGLSQSWNQSRQGMAQTVVGDYVINSYMAQPSSSESTQLYLNISNSIDRIGATVRLRASATRGSGTMFSQGEKVDRSYTDFSLVPSLDMRFLPWLNGNYSFSFSRNMMRLSGMNRTHIDAYVHDFSLTATPGRWRFTVSGSHSRDQVEPHRYVNRLDLNGRVAFRLNKRVELILNASNLLDKREYVLRSFNGLTSSESVSYLRGRELIFSIRISR